MAFSSMQTLIPQLSAEETAAPPISDSIISPQNYYFIRQHLGAFLVLVLREKTNLRQLA
jgi:hypothetical protein